MVLMRLVSDTAVPLEAHLCLAAQGHGRAGKSRSDAPPSPAVLISMHGCVRSSRASKAARISSISATA